MASRACWIGEASERERANLYERALEAGLPETIDSRARHELARLAKRQREFGYAAELWPESRRGPMPSFEACEQLCNSLRTARRRFALKRNGPRNWRSNNCGARSGSDSSRHGAMRSVSTRLARRLERLGRKLRETRAPQGKNDQSAGRSKPR